MRAISSSGWNGLTMSSSAPARSPLTRCSTSASAVSMMIGTRVPCSAARICCTAAYPSSFGIDTSIRIRSGLASSAISTPAAPSAATITS